ncbi:MAG: linear amide C-N hydrolase [Burkholderiales bacterium]
MLLAIAYRFIHRALVAVACLLAAGALVLAVVPAHACSDVMVPKDSIRKQVVSVRTLDFPIVDENWLFNVQLQAFEADRLWRSDWSGFNDGMAWKARYGFVGMTAFRYVTELAGHVVNMDGLNTAGLSAAFLWLDEAKNGYPPRPAKPDRSVAIYDVVNYMLSNFATVADAKRALTDPDFSGYIQVSGQAAPWIPLHVVVRDATGKSMIVEWIKGQQHIYDGDAVDAIGGVLTNSPPYPDQLAKLAEFKDVSPAHGLKGIPGDSTMQGRFIRLAKLREFALMSRNYNAVDALQVAAHLINNVDVPYGTNHEDSSLEDFTGPVLIRDHVSRTLYFKGNNNQSWRKIVLGNIDFGLPHKEGILADPQPRDAIYSKYEFAQDVTNLVNTATRTELTPNGPVVIARILVNVPPADRTNFASSMYVWALTPNRAVLQWNAGTWTAAQLTDVLLPAYVGPLMPLVVEVPLAGLPVGTEIYTGYGITSLEMLLKQRQSLSYVVPDPLIEARKR